MLGGKERDATCGSFPSRDSPIWGGLSRSCPFKKRIPSGNRRRKVLRVPNARYSTQCAENPSSVGSDILDHLGVSVGEGRSAHGRRKGGPALFFFLKGKK